jgi:hypothetical protein
MIGLSASIGVELSSALVGRDLASARDASVKRASIKEASSGDASVGLVNGALASDPDD